MKTVLGAILAILVAPGAALVAQESRDQFQTIRFHRVHLRNGNVIDGTLLSLTDDMATLRLPSGEMSIKRGMIEKIEFIKMRSLLERAPIVDKKKEEKKTDDQPAAPTTPKRDNQAPLPTPGGVPANLRDQADAIIETWKTGKSSDRTLAKDFLNLGSDVVPYLSLLLEERPKDVPCAAIAAALKEMGDARAIRGLSVAVKQGEGNEDRRQALLALIRIGTPETDQAILGAMEDPSSTVWKEAKDYLIEKNRKGSFDDLVDVLTRAMARSDNKVAYAMTLGGLGDPNARKELLYMLGSGDDAGKRAAMQGLSVRPVAEDGAEVSRYLNVRDEMLKREACLFVGKVKYAGAVPELIQILGDEDAGASQNAYWALKEITGEKLAADRVLWQAWYEASNLKKDLQK
jgi:HEAT repeat protein